MSAFKIVVLNQEDSQLAYESITTKEENTLYILRNGYGYIGEKLLFSGKDVQKATVTDMLAEGFTESESDLVSTKALIDFVADKLNDTSLINAHFFRKVENHIITGEEATAAETDDTDKFHGFSAGTPGLIFTADINGTDDSNTVQYFISLEDFVDTYTAGNTDSIHMSIASNGQITGALNVKSDETILEVTTEGVKVNKSTAIPTDTASDDKVPTEKAVFDALAGMKETSDGEKVTAINTVAPSNAKIPTEKAVYDYVTTVIQQALADVATYTIQEDVTQPTE